jgi:hypothetical protein
MSKITFEIKGTEYELPEYLSISNYTKIYNIKDFLEEQYFQAKLINLFTGVKMEDVLKVGHNQITFLSNHLMSLFPDSKYPFYDRFTFKGIDYGFIPSWRSMSFAEFVDLDTLMNKKPDEIVNNLHILCAIMYRPITKSKSEHNFEIEDYDVKTMVERAELFKNDLDVKYVLGGNFFFSKFVKKYLTPFPQSLIKKNVSFMRKMVLTWKMRKIIWTYLLKKHSGGTLSSTELAEMIIQNMKLSSKPPFWQRLTNFFTLRKKTNK